MDIPIPATPESRPPAPAKLRVLATADRLFSREGIRAVGVDWLIEDAQVTKATFYKHFRAKDRLVLDYLAARHRRVAVELAGRLGPVDDPRAALDVMLETFRDEAQREDQRGCAFLAAAMEHPDAAHPVRAAVLDHLGWLQGVLEAILADLGHPMPGAAADDLMIARDGALIGGYAGDRVAAVAALERAFEHARAGAAVAA